MTDRDAYICDVIVIPTDAAADHLDDLIKQLTADGLNVRDVNREQDVLEGTIDAGKIHAIEHHAGVQYVRCVYSYIADFPEGDARDVE